MFQVRATVIDFGGDEGKYPCHFQHKIGDEFIYDGEKYVGRICPGLSAVLVPRMIEHLKALKADPDSTLDLYRCAQRCVDLASGRYDTLSGSYLGLNDDLDEMLRKAQASTT